MNPNLAFLIQQSKKARVIRLQGGTRSGKTYSICQWVIKLAVKYKGLDISFVRKSNPVLKATVMRDFHSLLLEAGLYDERKHNKTEQVYHVNGNNIEFFSADNQQKLRGRKRHILICNEANELTLAEFRQLAFRTEGLIVLDYNPSMPSDHWIYENIGQRKDQATLITTYKDNPYLTPGQIAEIELLQKEDPELWKVYGEGVEGQITGLIYPSFEVFRDPPHVDEQYFGLDFGFSSDPAALILVGIKHGTPPSMYLQQVVYSQGLTNPDLIREMQEVNLQPYPIFADSARPDSIEEIRRAGYDIRPAKKGDNSIKEGIDTVKRFKLFVHAESTQVQKELRNYKWKQDSSGKSLAVPIDAFNHALDAVRYVAHMTQQLPTPQLRRIR